MSLGSAVLVITFLVFAAVLALLTVMLLLTLCSFGVCSIPIIAEGLKIVVIGIVTLIIAGAVSVLASLLLARGDD